MEAGDTAGGTMQLNDGLTRVINAEGFRFLYRRFDAPGSQRPAVFILNGFLQTMDSWVKYVHHFAREAPVIIADLPGAGDADPIPAGRFDLKQLARCAAAILEREGVAKIDVISASYGAAIGYAFAREYPRHVRHLMLAGVTRSLSPESRATIRCGMDHLRNRNMQAFAETVCGLLQNGNKRERIPRFPIVRRLLYNQLVRLPEDHHFHYLVNAQHLLDHPEMEIGLDPSIRILIVAGEFDTFTPPASGRAVAALHPHSLFTTIRNADHLFHLEQTGVTIRLIAGFFRDDSFDTIAGITDVVRMNSA